MSEPGPAPAKPKRRFLPRFTLRTLTLCVLLAASGLGLWWKWEPWAIRWIQETQERYGMDTPFSPDGSSVLSETDGGLSVLDSSDGRRRFDIAADDLTGQPIRFSADGRYLYSVDRRSPTLHRWNASSGSKAKNIEIPREADVLDVVNGCVYLQQSPRDPKQANIVVRAMHLDTGKVEHELAVDHVTFDRRFTQMACVSPDRHIEIYRLPEFERLARFPEPEAESFIFALFPEAGKVMVRTVQGDRLHILDSETGKAFPSLSVEGRANLRYELPADGALAIADSFDQARENIYDTSKNAILWSTDDSTNRSFSFSWSANGEYLAVTEYEISLLNEKSAYLVQGRTGKKVFDLSTAEGSVEWLWFSPSVLAVLVLGKDGTLTMWERRRPEQWWGVAWLPEFWLTVVFALLVLWSLIRDFKTLRRANRSGAPSV
ncbi:MAG: WD40 repeat domain-containing protein [Planctomycetes bacterium]|nr:WD40 repeat domain-containing protein [Planctomycetota bacterium]